VFVILTRGPFPSGDPNDGAVLAHLLRCPDCARLAEALRPSVDDQESIAAEESADLPGYWSESPLTGGELALSLTRHSIPPAAAQPAPAAAGRSALGAMPIWGFAIAVCLGILLHAAMRSLVDAQRDAAPAISGSAAGLPPSIERVATGRARHVRLSLLGLPAVCRQPPVLGGASSIEGVDEMDAYPTIRAAHTETGLQRFRCCTECHNAADAVRLSDAPRTEVLQSCQICHAL
jgi:hypothetical protein